MPRISKLIARLENRVERTMRRWLKRHHNDLALYIIVGILAWYFYGMLINSIHLGTAQTFAPDAGTAESIWVLNPIRNLLAVFTPTGLSVTAASALFICLISKKGYNRLSGYKATRDKRGFDILPDGTHGTSQFMPLKDMESFLEVGRADDLTGNIYGKHKAHPLDGDEFADYVASKRGNGLADNNLIVGAPGTGKSRGVVRPFMLQCAVKRRESIILTDPKAELYESMAEFLRGEGYEVRVLNLLDMAYSDSWNCISDADHDPELMQTIASTIIANTSNEKEAGDFWAKAELNLLLALLYYVQGQKDDCGKPLPIAQRSLGSVFRLLATMSITSLDHELSRLPPGHPARAPYGLFLQAKESIRGNIATGLGNRLSVFQNDAVDRITSASTIDLTLPGQKPCAYFCILSAQSSSYIFLSSLFFSMLFLRLEDYARRFGQDRKLPVTVNFCLDEFPNIGKLNNFKRTISVVRGYGMNCHVYVQSIAQIADMYPYHEWEEIAGACDTTIYLGGNDEMTAKFISFKCGNTTIRVTNNQMPLAPLFSPIYSSNRPYSQTRSNTQRALMMPDEVLRLDNAQCLVLLRGRQPMLLYKITPEELSASQKLRSCKISDYQPVTEKPTPEAAQESKQSDAAAVAQPVSDMPAASPKPDAPVTNEPEPHVFAEQCEKRPIEDIPEMPEGGGYRALDPSRLSRLYHLLETDNNDTEEEPVK